jgi:hypothetical protein
MKSSPEAVIVWAEAGPTAIATISATTVNNITIRFFMPLCSPFPPTSTWGAAARRTYSTYLVIRTAGVGGLRTLGPERTSQNTYLPGSSANKALLVFVRTFLRSGIGAQLQRDVGRLHRLSYCPDQMAV